MTPGRYRQSGAVPAGGRRSPGLGRIPPTARIRGCFAVAGGLPSARICTRTGSDEDRTSADGRPEVGLDEDGPEQAQERSQSSSSVPANPSHTPSASALIAEAIRDVAFHYIPRLAPGATGDGAEPMTQWCVLPLLSCVGGSYRESAERGRSELNDLYSSGARTRDPSNSIYSALVIVRTNNNAPIGHATQLQRALSLLYFGAEGSAHPRARPDHR